MLKLVVELNGGLGNQMFQYANARSIALQNNLELVIDDWSGFYRDFLYRRKFELNSLPIKGRLARFNEKIPFLYVNFLNKINIKFNLTNKFVFGNFIQEQLNLKANSRNYQPRFQKINLNHNTWLRGHWQSHYYFEKYKNLILDELTPDPPNKKNFRSISKEILNSESVALGIRVYEESKNPEAHALKKKTKNFFDINQVINKVIKKYPNLRFFVFCTQRFDFFERINLPDNSVFVTHDDGFEGSIERMWLLTQCKHHIFNNSSFYWWGAWLSSKNYQANKQIIYAADNFVNYDGYPKNWKKF